MFKHHYLISTSLQSLKIKQVPGMLIRKYGNFLNALITNKAIHNYWFIIKMTTKNETQDVVII